MDVNPLAPDRVDAIRIRFHHRITTRAFGRHQPVQRRSARRIVVEPFSRLVTGVLIRS